MYKQLLMSGLLALAAGPACKSKSETAPAADNTAQNRRDRAAVPTADNASTAAADQDLMQKIRKVVVGDGSLSTNAHNCKIIVQGDTVTLAGPVANDDERQKVERIAVAEAGSRKIVNQLEIAK